MTEDEEEFMDLPDDDGEIGSILFGDDGETEIALIDTLEDIKQSITDDYQQTDTVRRMLNGRESSFAIKYGRPDVVNEMITLSHHTDFRDAQLKVISNMMQCIIVNEFTGCRQAYDHRNKMSVEGISISAYKTFKHYWNYAEQAVKSSISVNGASVDTSALKKINEVIDDNGVLTEIGSKRLLTAIAVKKVTMEQVANNGKRITRKPNVGEQIQAIGMLQKFGAFEKKEEKKPDAPVIGHIETIFV